MIDKILPDEIAHLLISSLPTYPNTPTSYGGAGLSSTEMKQAFDALTLYVIERYNRLIEAIYECGEHSLSGAIPTGLYEDHKLCNMLLDIKNGNFASYLMIGDRSLATEIYEMRSDIKKIKEKIGL